MWIFVPCMSLKFRLLYNLSCSSESPGHFPAADLSSLSHTLGPLRPILDDPKVTEVCINRPTEAFIQTYDGWQRETLCFADFAWCRDFAKLVGSATKQRVDEVHPILSATLPTYERVQFVLPPGT